MQAKRNPQHPNALALEFAFSNNTPMPLNDLHFQLAVTKVTTDTQPPCLISTFITWCSLSLAKRACILTHK